LKDQSFQRIACLLRNKTTAAMPAKLNDTDNINTTWEGKVTETKANRNLQDMCPQP
jgi:hypothetical protein